MYRTHTCGSLSKKDIGKKVNLSGWIQTIKNLGSIVFINLRDYYGITQLVFYKKQIKKTEKLGREFVIKIIGKVIERKSKNYSNPTGEIEIEVYDLYIISNSLIPPFTIEDNTDGNEKIRMKYRYLDIRRNIIKNNLILRHKITLEIRKFFYKIGFLEIETPILTKYTPEGSRDFLVPSRINLGKFYSLPQSPQSFKQLLMIGGIDKYFQIVKCFRDEDFRKDRQLEFTQVDCEMSFVTKNDIYNLIEELISYLFKKIKKINIKIPFICIPYKEAIKKYGSDKPDLRFGMEIYDFNNFFKKKKNKFFDKKDFILGISIPNFSKYKKNKFLKFLKSIKSIKNYLKKIIWIKYLYNDIFFSSKKNFFSKKDFKKIKIIINGKPGDVFLILSGKILNKVRKILGKIRLEIANKIKLKKKKISVLWVENFPLLKWDKKKKRYHCFHHPFTSPIEENINFFKKNPEKIYAQSYDLIINGKEIGSGSIRIHNPSLQEEIFNFLGLSKKEIKLNFNFLIKALKYGAPPHGGIALGLDRLVTLFSSFKKKSIRDFIAFPKNNSGYDLMINSPSKININKLKEINIKLIK